MALKTKVGAPTERTPATPPPARQLVARRVSYVSNALACSALGVGGGSLASVMGHSQYLTPSIAAGVGASAAALIGGRLTQLRHESHDRLVEALAQHLSPPRTIVLDRRQVKIRWWSNGWPGHPQRVVIYYNAAAGACDPEWLPTILGVFEARFGVAYTVRKHRADKCKLVVVPATPVETAPVDGAHDRAQRLVEALIGETCAVGKVEGGPGEVVAIEASHRQPHAFATQARRAKIEQTVTTVMPGRWRAKWDLEADTVRFEQRPLLSDNIWLPCDLPDASEVDLSNYRDLHIPYAVDEDGHELSWYPARKPQLLMTGPTGGGKTSTAHTLVTGVAKLGFPVWVGDAKQMEFRNFANWPNVQIVATSVEEQVAMIHRAYTLMMTRYKQIKQGRPESELVPLVVFLDEFTQFVQALLEWYPDFKVKGRTKPPTLTEVSGLARLSRLARIHFVVNMQRPDISLLGGQSGELRDNFGQRIAMGRATPDASRMNWGAPHIGVSLPRLVFGRAMAMSEDGDPVEAQCYRFPDWNAPEGSDHAQLIQQLKPRESSWSRHVMVPAWEGRDMSTPMTWEDFATAKWVERDKRPDLDPFAADPSEWRGAVDLSSPTVGLSDSEETRVPGSSRPQLTAVGGGSPAATDTAPAGSKSWQEYESFDAAEIYEGYEDPVDLPPLEILEGDLVEVEDGIWAAVEEPPEQDPTDASLVALTWRSDDDDRGVLSVTADDALSVRRPEGVEGEGESE